MAGFMSSPAEERELTMRLISDLLALQDPAKQHTLLTRVLISAIIVFYNVVYYGFFGVMAAVVVYLLGVEILGLRLVWVTVTVIIALSIGLWRSMPMLADYWRNYGHGEDSLEG